MLNPHRELTEIALHLPPLEVQLQMLSVKFMAKCLTSDDFMSSVLLQAEGSLQNQFQDQLSAIKTFIAWKRDPSRIRSRQVDLLEPSTQTLAHYSKAEIREFEMYSWTERNKHRTQMRKTSSETDETVLELMNTMQCQSLSLNKDNFLFNYNTTKAEDSYLLDYIHGNSFLFANTRGNLLGEENKCSFCQENFDNRQHQLLECKEVQDDSHRVFDKCIKNHKKYLLEVLSSNKSEGKQVAFINRVRFLKGQHEFLLEQEQNRKRPQPK